MTDELNTDAGEQKLPASPQPVPPAPPATPQPDVATLGDGTVLRGDSPLAQPLVERRETTSVTTPESQDSPLTAMDLFFTRCRTLRSVVRDALLVDGSVREAIEARVGSESMTTMLLGPLEELRQLPVPNPDDVAAWGQVAAIVLKVWRQFFAVVKPVDQGANHALHNLSLSVAIPPMLAALAMKAQGVESLSGVWLDTHIDGAQTRELHAAQVEPRTILPLIEAIARARAAMAARAATA